MRLIPKCLHGKHIILRGDTLGEIARKYNLTMDQLLALKQK